MNKLSDYVKNYEDLFTPDLAKKLSSVLKDFNVLNEAFEKLKKVDINQDNIEIISNETVDKVMRIIDAVFHKENIVVRTVIFMSAIDGIRYASENYIKRRITTDIISNMDITSIIKEELETKRKQEGN